MYNYLKKAFFEFTGSQLFLDLSKPHVTAISYFYFIKMVASLLNYYNLFYVTTLKIQRNFDYIPIDKNIVKFHPDYLYFVEEIYLLYSWTGIITKNNFK